MNGQVVVDWRTVLPIADLSWRDSLDYVVGELQEVHGRILRPASLAEPRIDLLFVSYMAVDHERIMTDELLLKCLSNVDAYIGTLILIACDKAKRGSDISVDGVRELLILQGSTWGSDQLALRLPTIELFQDHVRACMSSHVRRRSLIGAYDGATETRAEVSPVASEPTTLFRPEYL